VKTPCISAIGGAERIRTAVSVPADVRVVAPVGVHQTKHWRSLRLEAIERADFRCERCNWASDDWWGHGLKVHHLTYERAFAELLEDVEVLCSGCHAAAHVEPCEDDLA
jgi:hypothetical protein